MLVPLFHYLDQLDFPGAGVFHYISFRSSISFILAMFIATSVGKTHDRIPSTQTNR